MYTKRVKTCIKDETIDRLFKKGDLAHINEIGEWAKTVSEYDERNWERKHVAQAIQFDCLERSDGAALHRLAYTSSDLNWLKHAILDKSVLKLEKTFLSNPIFLDELRRTLLPLLNPDDTTKLRTLLVYAIQQRHPISEFYDMLWSRSMSNKSGDGEHIKALYTDILREQNQRITDVSIAQCIICIGISRHIREMNELIIDSFSQLDRYSQTKFIEYASYMDISLNQIEDLGCFGGAIQEAKCRRKESMLFSSQVSHEICIPSPINHRHIVQRTLEQLDTFNSSRSIYDMKADIMWLLIEICNALEEKLNTKYVPLLVGSRNEGTQALFTDEFDFILRGRQYHDIRDELKTIVSHMASTKQHPRLVLESMVIDCNRDFPCLQFDYQESESCIKQIAMDLVSTASHDTDFVLPYHSFLDVSHTQQTSNQSAMQSDTYSSVNHQLGGSYDWYHKEMVLNEHELSVMKSLPKCLQEGFRLAKAIGQNHVIQQVVTELIRIGETNDIHKVIKTYHLKTCLFYLTEHFDFSHMEANSSWQWTILIYEKLRKIILIGNVKEFFDKERFLFGRYKIECKHSPDEFTTYLPRFHCCRRRKARLLIVDQILQVLHRSQTEFQ